MHCSVLLLVLASWEKAVQTVSQTHQGQRQALPTSTPPPKIICFKAILGSQQNRGEGTGVSRVLPPPPGPRGPLSSRHSLEATFARADPCRPKSTGLCSGRPAFCGFEETCDDTYSRSMTHGVLCGRFSLPLGRGLTGVSAGPCGERLLSFVGNCQTDLRGGCPGLTRTGTKCASRPLGVCTSTGSSPCFGADPLAGA